MIKAVVARLNEIKSSGNAFIVANGPHDARELMSHIEGALRILNMSYSVKSMCGGLIYRIKLVD